MTASHRPPAVRILGAARRLASPERAEWLIAMHAELAYVPPGQQMRFAAGCLMAMIVERNRDMNVNSIRPLDAGILLGSAALVLLGLANGMENLVRDSALAVSFFVVAAIWAGVFTACLLMRSAMMLRVAAGGGAVMLAIGLVTFMPAPAFTTNAGIMRALSLEGIVLFAALYGAIWLAGRRLGASETI